ncbi:MAG: hypothetical protein ABII22_03580 [Candidatus Micrarchaeota archaeon]
MKFDTKTKVMAVLFVLFLIGIYMYQLYSGMILILSLFVFGGLSLMWKEDHIKMMGLGAMVLLCIISIVMNGVHFGIEFTGGTRIPVLLEHPVDKNTMAEMTNSIKKRASVLGLSQVKVRAVGDSEIDIEVPSENQELIRMIEDTIAKQGVYIGVVDGKIAISGEEIYSQSVVPASSQSLQGGADWGVSFSVTKKGAEQFAEVVRGKPNYPIYMFLDRPNDAAVFVTMDELKKNTKQTDKNIMDAANDALTLGENGETIPVYVIGKDNDYFSKTNKTKAIISKQASQSFKDELVSKGFIISEQENMVPTYLEGGGTDTRSFAVATWEAVGLLDTRYLAPSITQGIPNYHYQITGVVDEKGADSRSSIKLAQARIESILKGGALPVQISLGGRTTLPATLGSEVQKYSIIGIVAALVAISLFIGIRYMHIKAIAPIIVICISELIILLAILGAGAFTIDLPAMAGIIAAIGVGVDAQVVITDELLKKDGHKLAEKVDHAFTIIRTNVVVAIIAMMPLLFSDLVEVIGFSIAAIIGSLLGYLLTRPAYAILAEKLLIDTKEEKINA